MSFIPLGAEINLGLQSVSLAIILAGLRFAIRTHKGYKKGTDEGNQAGAKAEGSHKNLMTAAVLVSGAGALIWMVPNFLLGWFYNQGGLGYGGGGYLSYFQFAGSLYPHWYLLLFMGVIGSLTAFLGAYLVLRMRWRRFPQRLAVKNFRAVMITTWGLWFVNVIVGLVVFYFYVLAGTG